MLKKIDNDVFDIAKRIKNIDRNYVIYFNTNKLKYEVYKHNVLQLTLPFKNLDKRTVDYVLKTHIKNFDKLINEIEMNNKILEIQNKKNIQEKTDYKTKELAKYLNLGKVILLIMKIFRGDYGFKRCIKNCYCVLGVC